VSKNATMRAISSMRWAVLANTAVAVLALLLAAGAPVFTNDVFWHVATGRHLFEHGLARQPDPFSFTAAGQPWFLHEWLTQVLFAAVHGLGGLTALRLLTAAFAAALVVGVARIGRRELRGRLGAALAVLMFLATAHARIQTRPTLLTMLALVLLLGRLMQTEREWRKRDAAFAIGLFLVWVNAHSVALIAIPLFGTFAIGRALDHWLSNRGVTNLRTFGDGEGRRLIATLVGMTGASFVTPAGPDLWGFAWQDKRDVMQYVSDEWEPFALLPSLADSLPIATWVGVMLTLATLLGAWLMTAVVLQATSDRLRSKLIPAPSRALLGAALLVGALMAQRFHWLVLFPFVMLAAHFHDTATRLPLRDTTRAALTRGLTAIGCGTLIVGAIGLTTVPRVERANVFGKAVHADYWRQELADFLRLPALDFLCEAGIEGNVVCHYNSGGLISYRGYPALRVSIDSRIDLYRRDLYLDYVAVRDGRPDQQAILDRLGADIYFRHFDLGPPVDTAAWLPVFASQSGEVWLRKGAPRTAANLERAKRWGSDRGERMSSPPR
jgi:hypothetical protein